MRKVFNAAWNERSFAPKFVIRKFVLLATKPLYSRRNVEVLTIADLQDALEIFLH
jgi:hypothetical protein